MSNPRAVIFGIAGPSLTPAEIAFFKRTQPFGFILFSRNIETPDQVKALVHELKSLVDHPNPPILIDQEGGRISRLPASYWRIPPAASVFGQLAQEDPKAAAKAASDNAWLMGRDLYELDITVNCAPCADIITPQTHAIIGDRSYGTSADVVAVLATHVVHGFLEAQITPVIKHMPGHGRSAVDSHEQAAPVYASREELIHSDFRAFRLIMEALYTLAPTYAPWGMTAHVIYRDIDSEEPATFSPLMIEGIIRGNIGFRGFLVSDCLTMKALQGPFGERTVKALGAGCDAVLHCSSHLDEMIEVASAAKPLTEEAWQRYRLSQISAALPPRQDNPLSTLKALEDALRQGQHPVEFTSLE